METTAAKPLLVLTITNEQTLAMARVLLRPLTAQFGFDSWQQINIATTLLDILRCAYPPASEKTLTIYCQNQPLPGRLDIIITSPQAALATQVTRLLKPSAARLLQFIDTSTAAHAGPVELVLSLALPPLSHPDCPEFFPACHLPLLAAHAKSLPSHATAQSVTMALRAAGIGTWHHMLQSNDLICDEGMAAILGLAPGQTLTTYAELLTLVHPQDQRRLEKQLLNALNDKTFYDVEYRIHTAEDDLRFIASRGAFYPAASATPRALIGISWDITERKKMEDWFRRQQHELNQVDRRNAMGEMASTLAHELNQPLAAIAGYAEGCIVRIESGNVSNGDLIGALRETTRQAERAGEIIHRMKNFICKGKISTEAVQIEPLITEVIDLMKHEARHYPPTINYLADTTLPLLHIDKVQIQQVLINLIRNAIQAMQHASTPLPTITIQTRLRSGDNRIEFTVTDNGPGVAADISEKLFELYATTKPEGMGLGLAICRTIIEAHCGQLAVNPNPAGGCEFHFTLPCTH